MYERSAIVLERYFENLLGFDKDNNIKQNFKNYCDLFEKFELFQIANSEEMKALSEFQNAENNIEEIQISEEKLYKKNAKLEYNRDLIFNDITQKPAEIEKCIIKIENDISKNQVKLISLRERFVEAVKIYNEKKSELSKCKKNRKNAEKDYTESFEIIKQGLDKIEEQYLSIAKTFDTQETQDELITIMSNNGKEEKIPFNNAVITKASKLGLDIFKNESECYLQIYKMSKKILDELEEGAVSLELHAKTIRNIKVKLNFLNAEKEYLVQFLDYERITAIYGKRTHRTLMFEACEKFEMDIVQIDNLYQLLLKEISNKSTKKAYKELYNKSYLIDIEEKDAKFKKEKNRINLPVGTVMNSNYWRIEGIKNIYTVFYKDVSEVFGKDLIEFDIPKDEEIIEEVKSSSEVYEKHEEVKNEINETVNQIEEIECDNQEENSTNELDIKIHKFNNTTRFTRKITVDTENEENLETNENINNIENIEEDNLESGYEESLFETTLNDDETDNFDEQYKNIEMQLAELEALEAGEALEETIIENSKKELKTDAKLNLKENIQQEKTKKSGILNKLIKLNSKEKKKVTN